MLLPTDSRKLTEKAVDLIATCRSTAGKRAALARSLQQWKLAGSADGQSAIYNKVGPHLRRLASYLFSPSELRFHLDFEAIYPREILQKGEIAARVLTREWERRGIDTTFGEGVDLSLTFGCCIPKLMWGHAGMYTNLVMPWNFGVYREDRNELSAQEAVCETTYITRHELWRRVAHIPNGYELYKRALAHAKRNTQGDAGDSYFHQVVLAGTSPLVQTNPPFNTNPGGFVDVTADYSSAVVSPEVASELIPFHELWVIDDAMGDYLTIQIAEPDILIAPIFRRANMFIPDSRALPYGIIRVNNQPGYFYGRSEIADLMGLQAMLRDRMNDVKKLMGLQYDRIYAFMGFGMNDEQYDQQRNAGWFSSDEPGAKIQDVTPELPAAAFTDINQLITFMDEVSGFQNILSGQGEPGVRAGNHAQTLLRTASPHLRDRALLAERQCAEFGDKSMQLMQAKDAKAYWTTPDENQAQEFLLSQLPDDYRVTVDSHSSSPIYQEDQRQNAFALAKFQAIDGDALIDMIPGLPNKDFLREKWADQQRQKAQFIQQHPEMLQPQRSHQKKSA